jgi:hypothetical protein
MVMASLVTVFGLRSLLSYVVTDLVGQRVGETDPTTGAFWHKAAAQRRAACGMHREDRSDDRYSSESFSPLHGKFKNLDSDGAVEQNR